MITVYTEADFNELSWHDCSVWSVELRAGRENAAGDELVLGLDFISEWIRGTAGFAQFRVAPARLVFHGVTGAVMTIDSKDSGLRLPPSGAAISSVERQQDNWKITFTWPSGDIRFAARGFTQTLLAPPVLMPRQHFSESERRDLLAGRPNR